MLKDPEDVQVSKPPLPDGEMFVSFATALRPGDENRYKFRNFSGRVVDMLKVSENFLVSGLLRPDGEIF